MIDIHAKIRAYLASLPGVTAAFGGRIYASRTLPAGYKPEQGPACLFAIRGGGQDFSSKLLTPSVQFRIYAVTEAEVIKATTALYDAINDTQSRGICYARLEDGTLPQMLSEPVMEWPYMLMYIKFHIQNEEV